MLKAVIFDMDGTMIDSEMMHFNAYRQALAGLDLEFNQKDYWRFWGPDKDMCKKITEEFDVKVIWEELLEMKNKIFRENSLPTVKPQKGLMNLLEKLKNDGYLLAVASTSQIHEIEIVLNKLKIRHFFNEITSAESVKNGKPAPDIYLLAAEKLGVLPEDCLVLEDAPKGVSAAKNANMKCYAIPNQEVNHHDFTKADKILESLEEVFPLL